jgi:phage terminase small subunit
MPNPRKPETIRSGHRSYPPSPEVPDKPIIRPEMSAGAIVFWDRLLPLVEDIGVMSHVDVPALQVLCELLAMHHASPNPKTAAQARMYLGQFGLTPASRAAFAAKNPDAPDDPFSDFDLD